MKKVFLLADDDSDDVELFREALSEIDSSAIFYHARDGQEALDQLENKSLEQPHIIFLDVNMPRLNGWQCLTKIKNSETLKDIPVMMYSTSSYQREVDIAFDLGALCFCTKPKDFKELKINLKAISENIDKNLLESVKHLKGIKCNKRSAFIDNGKE